MQARSLGDGKVFEVEVTSTLQGGEWKMHWATDDWRLPAQASWPEGTIQMDNKAVQTPLLPGQPRVIRFVGDELPRRLVFVLTDGTQWLNSGSSDFAVNLAPPSLRTTVDEILASEESSCLFIRYQKALALAPEMALSGDDGMALLFTWLRFSAQKQLRWYHKEAYNYQVGGPTVSPCTVQFHARRACLMLGSASQ